MTEYLCDEGVVQARIVLKEIVRRAVKEQDAIDAVVQAATAELAAKIQKRAIKCEGRCLEDSDDNECVMRIDPNPRDLVDTVLYGFFQNGQFNARYKAWMPRTVFEISCDCEPKQQPA
jgi:hypothetical protein